MFKLFDRYILKEIIPPFFIGLLIYTFVFLMNQILLLSEMFIARGVSFRTVFELLVFLIPSILAFTVPMSVLMGILAGLSRMSSDAEITALKTLGISYKRLLGPVLVFSFIGWLITSFLALYFAPRANYKWVQTLSESVLTKVQLKINPREFNESIPNTVIYIQDIMQDKDWKNIFVYFSDPPEEPRVIYAERGRLNFYPEEKRAILELFDGALHSYPLSNPEEYKVTSFKYSEQDLDVKTLFSSLSDKKRVREKDIRELFSDVKVLREDLEKFSESGKASPAFWQKNRDHISHQVEIHKKFALPFACFIFALLGLPLGASTKKGGRASGFTVSIGIIVIYYILITAGEQFAMDGRISPLFGMWGPNILFLVCGIYFFIMSLKESSLFLFFRFFKKKRAVFPPTERKGFIRRWPRLSLRFPNILDRYILRKYMVIFSMVFVSILAVFIIVTFFENIDKVYEHNKPLSLFLEFIWYKIPEFIHYILPITALTATLLCLGLLTKSNEMTAMKACGISLYRTIAPILLMAGLVSFFSFYLQENILPYSNKKVEDVWNKINDVPPRSYSHLDRRWVMSKNKDRIYYYRYFDPIASAFSQLSIYDIDPASWSLERRIYSEKGYLRDKNFFLSNCWYRDFEENKPVTFEEKKEMELTLAEDKSYFLKELKEPDQMSYGELREYIDDIEEKGFETVRFKVDLNYKMSFPLASLIMVLLGIPFAFSMGKRGTLVGIGLSVIIAMVFWGAIGVFKSLGYVNYLGAFLAAWGPNLIFGLIGLYLLFTLRT